MDNEKHTQGMTFDELMRALLAHCPDGEMWDGVGELVFYTGLALEGESVVPVDDFDPNR